VLGAIPKLWSKKQLPYVLKNQNYAIKLLQLKVR
jgi:hypothetical protein